MISLSMQFMVPPFDPNKWRIVNDMVDFVLEKVSKVIHHTEYIIIKRLILNGAIMLLSRLFSHQIVRPKNYCLFRKKAVNNLNLECMKSTVVALFHEAPTPPIHQNIH